MKEVSENGLFPEEPKMDTTRALAPREPLPVLLAANESHTLNAGEMAYTSLAVRQEVKFLFLFLNELNRN